MKKAAAERTRMAHAIWYVRKGEVELRAEPLREPARDDVVVRTLFSAISRGTERLILSGTVPQNEWERMRAPLQAGKFSFPVKYGYCAAGVVETGPSELVGRTVFVLHPHQDLFTAPVCMAVPLPDGVPPRRATLAANMETALNAVWDAGCGPADRIVVVGGGAVGMLVGYLCARMPGADVTLVDIEPDRGQIAEQLGLRFALPPRYAYRSRRRLSHLRNTARAGRGHRRSRPGRDNRRAQLVWGRQHTSSVGRSIS